MKYVESILIWSTIFLYVVSFVSHLLGVLREKPRALKLAACAIHAGVAAHILTICVRWQRSGHAPVTDAYELDLTGTCLAMLLYLVFARLRRVNPVVGLVVVPIVFLALGHGIVVTSDPIPMGPAYRSLWLVVHVIFAWLAFGSFAVATGAAAILLWREYRPSHPAVARLPASAELDLSAYRFVVLGVINHAIMLTSGSIWGRKLWGRYWSWDALETWSLIVFLFYIFYLHARVFLDWKMRKAAWLAIVGLVIVIVSFWGVNWIAPSVHPGL